MGLAALRDAREFFYYTEFVLGVILVKLGWAGSDNQPGSAGAGRLAGCTASPGRRTRVCQYVCTSTSVDMRWRGEGRHLDVARC